MIFLGARRSGHVARGSQKGQRGRGQAGRSSRPRSATPATPLGDTISRADRAQERVCPSCKLPNPGSRSLWFSTRVGTAQALSAAR